MPKRLAVKLIFWLTLLVAVVDGLFAFINLRVQERQLLSNMVVGADQLSRSITSATWQAMLADNREGAYAVMRTIAEKQGIERIRIFNKDGRVMFSTDLSDEKEVDKQAEACVLCHAEQQPLLRVTTPSRSRTFEIAGGRRMLGLVTPIYNEPSCSTAACHAHPVNRSVLGVLDVTMGLDAVDRELAGAKIQTIVLGLIQAFLIAVFIVVFIRRFVDRPIRKLIEGTKAVSAMDLDRPINVTASVEIEDLARSFNIMRERLKEAQREQDEFAQRLESKVAERTSQLRLAQQKLIQSDRLASLGQLSASVAHEINNPVSGVLNLAVLLQRIVKDDGIPPGRVGEVRGYLSQIATETTRVGRIVSDLLAFSRRSKPRRGLEDVNKILGDTLSLLSHKLELLGVRTDMDLQGDLPRISCDASQLQQVLMNLIINGAEAIQGGGLVTVRTSTAGDYAVIEVSDTGTGIPREHLSKIFDPFFTTKEEGHGTGLGLAVAYGIVEAHGGDIEVESQVGRGTTFRVTLPLLPRPAPGDDSPPAARPRGSGCEPGADHHAGSRARAGARRGRAGDRARARHGCRPERAAFSPRLRLRCRAAAVQLVPHPRARARSDGRRGRPRDRRDGRGPFHPDAHVRLRPGAAGRPGRARVHGAARRRLLRPPARRGASPGARRQGDRPRARPHVRSRALPRTILRHVALDPPDPDRRKIAILLRRLRRPAPPRAASAGGPGRPSRTKGDTPVSKRWEILVVDDERVMRESMAAWLREDGYAVDMASSGQEAVELARQKDYAVYFIDLKMPPGMDGIETLMEVRLIRPDAAIVIITAYATVDTAITALKEGAQEYIVKPCNPEEISLLVRRIVGIKTLQRENRILRKKLSRRCEFQDMISKNPRMHEIFDLVKRVASLRSTVLVTGESGTGKEMIARAIHDTGDRSPRPFVPVSCAALAETLLESELFGYEKGAFTGAGARKKGKFELADGGTIFLDEIGDISPKLQLDLLRVLQERKFFRVGGTDEVEVDVRVIAATKVDLLQAVRDGRFRDDLFYRLNVITIEIPPLRQRPEDIPLLARDILDRLSLELGKGISGISEGALALLMNHDWPGNVRELENAIERAIVTCSKHVLTTDDFGFLERPAQGGAEWTVPTNLPLAEIERQVIEATLKRTSGNVKEVSEILGVDRSTIYERIRKYNIPR